MGLPTRWSSCLFLLVIWVHQIVGPPAVIKQPPANQTVPDHPDNLEKPEDDLETRYNLEYNRYLKEVVDALESDPEFRRKLETAEEVDFRNGKVAAELEYVNHHVRTKLDELKRTELGRLRELLKMEEERKKAAEDPHHHGHLDHSNPHTFEVQDLQMLMNKVRRDLDQADVQRREEFKEYEMQKEFEKEQKLKAMDEEHKKEYLKELEEEKKKAQHHDPVHHPGSEAQLEEVWEKQDQMSQKFDPKAFFYLHDLDGNGYWDEQEVNALFIKELDKIYATAPNNHVDMREREEEMERMREHVFKETDTNRDRFISYNEFLEQTKRDEWRRDEGWESIDQKPQFTQTEYEEFERRRQAEIQRLIDQGVLQAHPQGLQPPYYAHPGQGGYPNAVPQYHPAQGAGMPINQGQYQAHPAAQQQFQAHPGAQQHYQGHPNAGQPQYQQHQAAQQHLAAQQNPSVQQHPAAQQYQAHPGVPQQQFQHPQQQYQGHPNQAPQYQQQVPVQQFQQMPPGAIQQPPQYQQQYQPNHQAAPPHAPSSQNNQAPPVGNQASPPANQASPPANQAPPPVKPVPVNAIPNQLPPSSSLPSQNQAQPVNPSNPQQANQQPPVHYNSIPDNTKNNEIHGKQ